MSDLQLSCECGQVKGTAINITPNNGNHVVCCCCDCQAFVHHLNKGDTVLDEFGGTRLFQTSQSQVKITQGAEKISCLRLTKKGITRWYTSCCNTPLGNTVSSKVPFVGIISSFIQQDSESEKALGPVQAYVQTQYATKPLTHTNHNPKFGLAITLRIIAKILGWKIRGMGKPSAFYDGQGKSIVKPIVLK
jgi:hypothetical protein